MFQTDEDLLARRNSILAEICYELRQGQDPRPWLREVEEDDREFATAIGEVLQAQGTRS